MPLFLYLPPYNQVTLNAPVSGGPTDADHQAAWLCDGRVNRPVLSTTGSPSWTVTPAAGSVNFISAANTSIDDGKDIDIGGGLTATLMVNRRGDSIKRHPWSLIDPAVINPAPFTVGVTANSVALRIGELFAGTALELERGTLPGGQRSKEYRAVQPGRWSSIPGYRPKQDRWNMVFQVTATKAQYELIQYWEESTYWGQLPSVIVPDVTVTDDSYVVEFLGFEFLKQKPDVYDITLNLREFPRTQWV